MNTAAGNVEEAPATGNEAGSPFRSLARLVLVEAAALGVLADATLRSNSLGAGFAMWTLGLVATVVLVAFRSGRPLRPLQYVWLGLSIICSIAFAWRDADMLQFMNFVAAHAALVMFTVSAIAGDGQVFGARFRDLFRIGFRTATDSAFGVFTVLGKDADITSVARRAVGERLALIRAIAVAIPLLLVFGALLSSADPVFAELVSMPAINLDTVMPHLIIGGGAAWVSTGWMRSVFLREREEVGGAADPIVRIGTTDITVVLGSLNVLFTLFVMIQARWLFGGADVIRETTGLSVAAYARRGFFELVTVAALSLPLLLVSRALAEGNDGALRRHRQMAFVMLGLMGGIMVSAVQRMTLYVGSFGLTTDRVYALAFMAWLASVFATMGFTVLRGWLRPFAAYSVLSAYAGLVAMNVANPEAAVARYEINRTDRATPIDWKYLGTLSGDALPVVVPAMLQLDANREACDAAQWAIYINSGRARGGFVEYNAGEWAGHQVVLESFTPHSLRRLCGGSSATSPSASLSR